MLQNSFAAAGMGFIANPLDRNEDVRRDPQALERLRTHPEARWLLLHDLKPLMDITGPQPVIAWQRDICQDAAPDAWVYLGQDKNNRPCFACTTDRNDAPDNARWIDARSLAMELGGGDASIAGQARALVGWHLRHRYCAVCGKPSHRTKGGYGRICSDADCAAEHFPRTDPVVIMLVVRGDACLLGRQAHFPPGMYSALAGFVEPAESIEEAVAREVFEESGIRVGQVRYLGSQPWPFPSSLMIGCIAEGRTDTIRLDTQELEDARWFSRADAASAMRPQGVNGAPPKVAIAYHLLSAWLDDPALGEWDEQRDDYPSS